MEYKRQPNMETPVRRTGILLAAFGSSSPRGEKALSAFAEKTRRAFPGIPVRWAFTSDLMRSRLAAARKKTDSVQKALMRMAFERYTHVAVQSLHLIPGKEYEALLDEAQHAGTGAASLRIQVGLPLLYTETDLSRAADSLLTHLPVERKLDEQVICVGHGTWHGGAASYQSLSEHVRKVDPRIFIGTLEGEHAAENILPQLDTGGSRIVWLLPLLSIIGKHAERDIAGNTPDSWQSRLREAGFTCRPVLRGTVEYEGFAEIWLSHLASALTLLAG